MPSRRGDVKRARGGEPAGPARTTSRETVRLHELAADLWRCPEALGRQLFPAPGP